MAYRFSDEMAFGTTPIFSGNETIVDGKVASDGMTPVQGNSFGFLDNTQTHQNRTPIAEMSSYLAPLSGPENPQPGSHGGSHRQQNSSTAPYSGTNRVRFGDSDASNKSMMPIENNEHSLETPSRLSSSSRNHSGSQLFLTDNDDGANTNYVPREQYSFRPPSNPSTSWLRGMGTESQGFKGTNGYTTGQGDPFVHHSPMRTPGPSNYPTTTSYTSPSYQHSSSQYPSTPTSLGNRSTRNKRRLPSPPPGDYPQAEDDDNASDSGPSPPKARRAIKTQRPIEDPDNRLIKDLRVRDLKGWDDIAKILNAKRRERGAQDSLTEAAVYGRFKRNAKPIAESEGNYNFDVNDYMYLKKTSSGDVTPGRKDGYFSSTPGNGHGTRRDSDSPTSVPQTKRSNGRGQRRSIATHQHGSPLPPPRISFSHAEDRYLVDAVNHLEDGFWGNVADIVSRSSRRSINPSDCQRRFSNLRGWMQSHGH